MVQLNASTLSSVKMARGVAPKTERVIQFGEGGFLRAIFAMKRLINPRKDATIIQ